MTSAQRAVVAFLAVSLIFSSGVHIWKALEPSNGYTAECVTPEIMLFRSKSGQLAAIHNEDCK